MDARHFDGDATGYRHGGDRRLVRASARCCVAGAPDRDRRSDRRYGSLWGRPAELLSRCERSRLDWRPVTRAGTTDRRRVRKDSPLFAGANVDSMTNLLTDAGALTEQLMRIDSTSGREGEAMAWLE